MNEIESFQATTKRYGQISFFKVLLEAEKNFDKSVLAKSKVLHEI